MCIAWDDLHVRDTLSHQPTMIKKYAFRTAMFLLFPLYSFAANYIVSGAGSTAVNAKYTEAGVLNGKPYYVYSIPMMMSSYQLSWTGTQWQISQNDMIMGTTIFYTNTSNTATPPVSGWAVGTYGLSMPPTVEAERKSITFNKKLFVELHTNDGTTSDTIQISYNKFGGDAFTGQNGDDFAVASKIIAGNIPAGMTASILRKSDSTLIFILKGSAKSHVNADDAKISIAFAPAAFTGNDTANTVRVKQTDILMNFREVFKVSAVNGVYATISAAIAGVTNYDILDLGAETFTEVNIQVTKPLIFAGKGANMTFVQAHALKDAATGRVFTVGTMTDVVYFKSLTIRNGKVDLGNGFGGGVSASSPMEFYDCAISNNIARSTQNGATSGGGISGGSLKLYNCLVNDNTCINGSDAGQVVGGGFTASDLTMVNTTVTGNYASGNGGGVYCTNATLINSTVAGNTSKTAGGGMTTQGAGTYIINSILSGNTATTADAADFSRSGGTVNVAYSIITAAGLSNQYVTGLPLNGYRVNMILKDPMMEALSDNGGPTKTIALKAGSPAIDAGLTTPSIPASDQRGFMLIGQRDLGAYESSLCGPSSNTFAFPVDTVKVAENSYMIEAGGKFAEYSWSTGETTASIIVGTSGKYKLTVKDTLKGCDAIDSIVVQLNEVVSGTRQTMDAKEVCIYPNPSKGILHIKNGSGSISVSGLLGNLVTERNFSNGEALDLSDLPKGMYLVMIKPGADRQVVQRIIIE
jgi:predicted outer membrane repeat protein